MVKLVAFDWNGTLLADTQACVDAGNAEIVKFGGTPITRKKYLDTFDLPVADFLLTQGCDQNLVLQPNSHLTFHETYEKRISKCRTRVGAREVLNYLKDNFIEAVILSNHLQDQINVQLERLNLTSYFQEILSHTDYVASSIGKNKVNIMIDYLACTGKDPSTAVMVGDSPEDVDIGKRLGMISVAITGGSYSTSRLKFCNPDYVIGSLRELIDIVK